MSQRTVYVCDVCQQDSNSPLSLTSVLIEISGADHLDPRQLKYAFSEVCTSCRERLIVAVEDAVESIRNGEQ